MNTLKRLERVQISSSIYDYFAAGIFAFPVIASWYLGSTLHNTHDIIGASGNYPVFDPLHLLFVNLFGAFAVMWSTLSIIKPEPVFGLCDGFLRLYYACIMCLYVLFWSTTSILIVFIVVEIFWGSWQLFLYYSARKQGQI